MSPVERAAEVYKREWCARTFREDLEIHLIYGFVFSRPDYFVMGRPVISTAPEEEIVNPLVHFPSTDCDAWHIALFSGNIARSFHVMPWRLPRITMQRQNELRIYELSAIERLFPPSMPS
jgi:hypothetical protein